ncbi:MAG: ribosomal RNA small subunit methyltransferase A [Deltaproteobacteria bacterium]|nr:ribosomal RNA small subunit methyltransferase A [Deltaproteobacteria bacterium]
MSLEDRETPGRLLRRYGLSPKKAFSQNFMVSPQAVAAVVRGCLSSEGNEGNGGPVVELGAGLGTLTAALARAGARVYAVERDRDLVAVLEAEFARSDAVQIVAGNAATIDFSRFTSKEHPRIRVVGNLPYAITGAIIKHLTASRNHLSLAVLTLQREVSDRLQADPGSPQYGALTVFAQAAFRIRTVKHLSASAFFPRPKVTSSIIQLIPLDPPRAIETDTFRALVHAAFQGRRKMLRNALNQMGENDAARIGRVLSQAGIDGRRRGETLSIEEFARLSAHWDKCFEVDGR